MKRIFLYFMAVLLIFSGCDTYKQPNEVAQVNDGLTIYIGKNDYAMQVALPIFQQKYPDISVEVLKPQAVLGDSAESQIALQEEHTNLLSSLMAGGGPDVLTTDSLGYMMNLEIMATNGVFADMGEFYDSDTTLDPTLNKTVMDAGVFDDKRFLFPLGYTLPLLLSTEETLAKNDFHIEACSDYQGFLAETERVMSQNSVKIMPTAVPHTLIFSKAGVNPVDIENSTIDTDLPVLKTSLEWIQKAVASFSADDLYYYQFGSTPEEILAVCNGDMLFLCTDPSWGYMDYAQYNTPCQLISSVAQTPILVPVRNTGGGLTASVSSAAFVRANSRNKENAYKFIQVLLGKEVQSHSSVRAQAVTSVSADAMHDYYQSIKDANGGPVQGFPLERPKFSEEQHNQYMAFADEIDCVQWYDWGKKIVKYMRPYFLGEESYEKCIQEAKWDIELELGE